MDQASIAVLNILLEKTGLVGLGGAVVAFVAYKLHETRSAELKANIEEHKADKADYRHVITGNTEAIGKMAGAIETNTQTIRDLRNYMERKP